MPPNGRAADRRAPGACWEYAPGELGERRIARGAQGTGRSPAKRPGVFLFGDFLLDKQEKVTQGAGAEPPAISL